MTRLRLSIRSTLFYWRSHVSVLAGTTLACAVLTGALLVGDSVKYSLKQAALLRLGNIHYALNSQGRFFLASLADRLESKTGIKMAPALLLRGVAIHQKGAGEEDEQVNNIQVIGVDERFWPLANGQGTKLTDDSVAVNAKLAARLGIKPGDDISIRIAKPSLLPRDAPLSSRKGDDTVRRAFSVSDIVSDSQLGRFSLTANQIAPYNVFVSLKWLQKNISLDDRANLILSAGMQGLTDQTLNEAIKTVWRIEDAGLAVREFNSLGLFQLESDRIFMDPAISRAALSIDKSAGSLTYLVNSISRKSDYNLLSTPYSFVEALSPSETRTPGVVSSGMNDDEIILNRWLADCLSARTGQLVSVSYYELTPSNKFIEKSRAFKVSLILEMADVAGERELAPRFPGLTDVDRCTEWDIGIPMEKNKMEDKPNEAYWKAYRATPKAFVNLNVGQAMWANRFGNLSAVRYAFGSYNKDLLSETLRNRLDPHDIGLTFVPVRESALKAAGESMDFGQLFLGMSFFLIVAGLMLTGLLFVFGIQQRSEEIGLLLAVGYRPRHVRSLLIQESCLVAGLGSLAGAFMGTYYTKALIWGLSNFWQGAVANSAIRYHAEPMTVATGVIMSFICAMIALVLAMRHMSARSARELLAGEAGQSMAFTGGNFRGQLAGAILSTVGILISAGIIAHAVSSGAQKANEAFFMAGALLLISGIGMIRQFLVWLNNQAGKLSVAVLGMRNAGRRRGRSLTVAALLACGCFMVFAVSSMQEDVSAGADKPSSGTGGFALFGESTIPVQSDLNSPEGQMKFKLAGEEVLKDAKFVSIKVRDGDDASCLNLNHAQSPRLLGVDPGEFTRRDAFMPNKGDSKLWDLINGELSEKIVPGLVGDSNTAMWGLKKKVGREGDILTYLDERGQLFRVKLVGSLPMRLSVFQGSILIPASSFAEKFPSESGYRMFLVDAPLGSEEKLKECLSGRLGKYGIDFIGTVGRLREFYAVESTYMAMFLILGGMGLLLGSAGMGIVVLRNIIERRGELALLQAIGYSRKDLRKLVFVEHALILAMGLALGVLSSLAAMWPHLHEQGSRLPYVIICVFLAGIALFEFVCIAISVWFALRGSLINVLRNE